MYFITRLHVYIAFFQTEAFSSSIRWWHIYSKDSGLQSHCKKKFSFWGLRSSLGYSRSLKKQRKNIAGDWYCHLTFDVHFTFGLILYFLRFLNFYIRSLDVSIHQPLCTVTERGMTVNCFKLVTECKDSPKTEAVLLSMQHNDIHDLKKIL